MSIRIFVTTDNHVGYNETDAVQCDDAANSFAEAMTIAQNANVDFVIQGGDLFHVNKPTKRALYSVIKTLRRTCLGDKPVEFEVLNYDRLALDNAEDFDYPNFEDPNLNVALPVFAISGNHDDAGGSVGSDMLSPLDILGMTGLLNHFGRVPNSADIVVKPILIEKAGIRVALYGLASIRDERLYRTFRENKVKFVCPRQDPETWYNILVVHQNRVPHGPTNFLPEEFIPKFVDLVIWGHEHDCRIDPETNHNRGFAVMQPGSTVVTSLHESEIQPKHVAILSISANKSLAYEKIPLKTVRPFAMRTVSLHEHANINPGHRDARAKVTEYLIGQVEELIEEARLSWMEQHNIEPDQVEEVSPPLPLIRLRVDYTGYDVENTTRFSNRFVNQVANTSNVLSLIKRRVASARIGPKGSSAEVSSDDRVVNNIKQVGQLLHELLTSETLSVLPERDMEQALTRFVEKDEKLALKYSVDDIVKNKVSALMESVNDLNINGPIMTRMETDGVSIPPEHSAADVRRITSPTEVTSERPSTESPEVIVSDSEEEMNAPRNVPARNTGPSSNHLEASGSEPSANRATRTTRNKRPTFEFEPSPMPDEDDSDDMFSPG